MVKRRRTPLLPPLLLALLTAGCVSTKAPEQTAVMEQLGVEVTAQRLRVSVHTSSNWFMSSVEIMADSIMRLAVADPVVRHNALKWKTNGIPAIQRAVYQADPFISYMDGWTLLVQMRQYYQTGGGQDDFGPYQGLAVDRLLLLEDMTIEAVNEMRTHGERRGRAEAFVYQWADAHPITNNLFQRRSVSEYVADMLGEKQGGGFSSIGTMTEMAGDAQQMAVVMSSYLPKQAAWQTELLIAELMDSLRVAGTLSAIDDMEVARATAAFMRTTPELIASERAAVFLEIAEERYDILSDIERQRIATLAELTALVTAEREAILRQMAAMIAAERAALMEGTAELTVDAFRETRALVNHLMLIITILGAALVVVLFFGVPVMARRMSG